MVDSNLQCMFESFSRLTLGLQVTGDTANLDMSKTVKDATLIVTTVRLPSESKADESLRSGTQSRGVEARVRGFWIESRWS